MSSVLETFLNLVLIGLETWMMVFASSGFFQKICSGFIYYLSIFVLFMMNIAVSYLFAYDLSRYVVLKYIITAVFIVVWLMAVYRAGVIKGFFFAALILSYFVIVDEFGFLFIAWFAGDSVHFAFSNPYALFSIYCITKIIELFGIVLIHNLLGNRLQGSRWTEWIKVLIFPAASLLISVFLSRIILGDTQFEKELAVCLFVLLLVDIMSIHFLSYLERTQVAIRDNALLRQNLKLESEHIISLQESYTQQRRQTHDFYNQLAVLQGMAEKKVSLDEFSEYLGKLLTTKVPSVFYIDTHRIVVDVVLSQKVTLARQKGIDFQLCLENLADFPLPDDILVVVLTNLIDNAVEACDKISNEHDRYIKLTMKRTSANAWICIENRTSEPVSIRGNQVQTTKGDPLLHGYGLKNIGTLLSKFGGSYTLDYREKEKLFCFYSTLPCEQKA